MGLKYKVSILARLDPVQYVTTTTNCWRDGASSCFNFLFCVLSICFQRSWVFCVMTTYHPSVSWFEVLWCSLRNRSLWWHSLNLTLCTISSTHQQGSCISFFFFFKRKSSPQVLCVLSSLVWPHTYKWEIFQHSGVFAKRTLLCILLMCNFSVRAVTT